LNLSYFNHYLKKHLLQADEKEVPKIAEIKVSSDNPNNI